MSDADTPAPSTTFLSDDPDGVVAQKMGELRPKRRMSAKDFKWAGYAILIALVARILLTEQLRLKIITGSALVQGALIAAIALGVVLTYRGSGVVNFATGATAMYTSYVYAGLRVDGKLFLPPLPNPLAPIEGVVHLFDSKSTLKLPRWPTFISFGGHLTLVVALIVSLVFCVLFGFALHFLIFRPLRHAPPLAKVVASVGILLLLQAIIVRRFGTSARPVYLNTGQPIQRKLPLGIKLTQDQIIVIVLVLVFTALLWALFRFTRFGLATRAAAENEKGATLLGFSPEFLAGSNWILSTVISGLLGILVAGNSASVDPVVITYLVIPALSVALVGGLSSFWITTGAAFGLALSQNMISYFSATRTWFPKAAGQSLPGVKDLLPFVLIVFVLFFRGKSLPTRGAVAAGRLPFAPNPTLRSTRVFAPIAIAACAISLMFIATPNGRLAIITSLIGIVISLSFVVVTGYIGQISLAQMMLAGISGFTVSKLTTHGIHLFHHTLVPALPFIVNALVGAVFATIVGMLVALPALRVRGVNLAIVTFAFAIAMNEFLFKNPGVNGGFAGSHVKVPRVVDIKVTSTFGRGSGANANLGLFLLAIVVILCALVVNLRRSATGRRMLATRSNERAAAAAGVDVARMKLTAFAIASFIAGLGGALAAYRLGQVDQLYFGETSSLVVLAFAYLGGISCISGAVTAGLLIQGGVFFTVLEKFAHVPGEFTLILGGLALIVTAIMNPEGVAGGVIAKIRERERARRAMSSNQGSASRASVAPGAASAGVTV